MNAARALEAISTRTYLKKAIKGSLIGIILVPIFHVLLNPHVSFTTHYFMSVWISVRIGLEVVLTNILFSGLFYSALYRWSPTTLYKMQSLVKFRFLVGFVGMTLGLLLASTLEPVYGEREFGIQGLTAGLLVGSITYLVFLLLSAYRQSQTQNLKLRAESAEATMNVLKNQMQPHFLFNSLNSLAELIDSNQDHAATMTQKLSDLYREILEASSGPMAELEVELSIVKKYMELESLRFGSRMKYSIQAPAEAKTIILPSLILQTLVENAVKHGISQNINGGSIHLAVYQSGSDGYMVQIENTSAPIQSQTASPSGKGLANSKARLDLVYADKHGLDIQIGAATTVVRFWISGV